MELTPRKKRGFRYWFNLLAVGLLGGALLFFTGYMVLWTNAMSRPAPSSVCCETPADLGFDYQDVTFTSDDGTTLSGWYIPSQNGAAVIVLHGYQANRTQMMGRAEILARAGYGVLLYDLRAHGESEGDVRALGWEDAQDVAAALQFVEGRDEVDPGRIGILGFSVGGQVALQAAAQLDVLSAVVAEEPGFVTIKDIPPRDSLSERWITFLWRVGLKMMEWRTGLSKPPGVTEVVGAIAPRPILFISSGPDDEISHRLVSYFYDFAGQPKEIWRVPETGHGGALQARPDEYEERIVTFFDGALLEE